MKGKTLTIIGIFAAALAAVLILCHSSISIEGVTITCGIIFVLVGLINMLFYGYKARGAGGGGILTVLTNSAALMLGISMMVYRMEFTPMIAFMFGLFVSLCALWQLYVLTLGSRPYRLPVWLYAVPALLVAGAIFIFMCKANEHDSNLILATGISMAVLGVGCIMEGSVLGVARANYHHAQKTDTITDVEALPAQQPGAYPQQSYQPQAPYAQQPYQPQAPYAQQPNPDARDADADDRWSWRSRNKRVETTDDLDDEFN